MATGFGTADQSYLDWDVLLTQSINLKTKTPSFLFFCPNHHNTGKGMDSRFDHLRRILRSHEPIA